MDERTLVHIFVKAGVREGPFPSPGPNDRTMGGVASRIPELSPCRSPLARNYHGEQKQNEKKEIGVSSHRRVHISCLDDLTNGFVSENVEGLELNVARAQYLGHGYHGSDKHRHEMEGLKASRTLPRTEKQNTERILALLLNTDTMIGLVLNLH